MTRCLSKGTKEWEILSEGHERVEETMGQKEQVVSTNSTAFRRLLANETPQKEFCGNVADVGSFPRHAVERVRFCQCNKSSKNPPITVTPFCRPLSVTLSCL